MVEAPGNGGFFYTWSMVLGTGYMVPGLESVVRGP